jgi:hypothetical protein
MGLADSSLDRRTFLAAAAAAGTAALSGHLLAEDKPQELFKISLAEWSLHKTLFGGKLDNLDFAKTAKQDYGIEAIEFVNQFFKDKAKDEKYLAELKKRAEDQGVKMLLIMCDGEGAQGMPTRRSGRKRSRTITNGSKQQSSLAATRSASTPSHPAALRNRRSWRPTASRG